MFRNKFSLINLAKNCKNQLKYKVESSVSVTNGTLPHCLVSRQIFSHSRTDINGFHEVFTLHNKDKMFGGSKKLLSKLSSEKCWKCKQYVEVKKIKCSSCGVLQYPKENINYFELFSMSQMYDINLEELSLKFKNLQKTFHPDKFANQSKEEQEISEIYSRLINKGYTTLKDPLARGFYILDVQKVSLDQAFPLEQEFLMHIMEKNEQLESIESEKMLCRFLKSNNEEVDKYTSKVSDSFRSSKWDDAQKNLLKLKYYINLDKKIKKKKEALNS